MITEDYVSFETAKLLKEKGFDEKCESLWITDTKESDWIKPKRNSEIKDGCNDCMQPTIYLAMKWLREVHNIAIETEWEHLWYAYIKPMTSKPSEEDYYQCVYSKYEDACEAAIKYCLENLI